MFRCISQVCISTNVLRTRQFATICQHRYSMYDPDYLNIKPEIPSYDTLNIRMRGYDFPVLESYAKYVHRTASSLGLASNAYPVPARVSKIQTFKQHSTQVQNEYQLALCERVVQVDNLTTTLAPVFLEVLQANLPAGVEILVKEHNEEEEEFRYVPDLTLLELKSQHEQLERAKEERKRK